MWAELWQVQWLDNGPFGASCTAQTMVGLFWALPQIAAVLVWGFKMFMNSQVREGMKNLLCQFMIWWMNLTSWHLMCDLRQKFNVSEPQLAYLYNEKIHAMWILRSFLYMKFHVLYLGPSIAWLQLSLIAFLFFFKQGIQERGGSLLCSMFKKWTNNILPHLKCPKVNSLSSPQTAFFSSIPHLG